MKKCKPCRSDTYSEPQESQVDSSQRAGWETINNHHLAKSFAFPDFAKALEFVNCVAAVAEEENHHPDIYLAWGKVRIEIWTHAVDGLTGNDFVLAEKIDLI